MFTTSPIISKTPGVDEPAIGDTGITPGVPLRFGTGVTPSKK